MKRSLLVLVLLVLSFTTAHAQLSGSYTVGAGKTYASIGDAIDALNTLGVSGNVVFLVSAGHTETLVNKVLTNTTPTVTRTVSFQKSGTGANPKITAGTGTGNFDGVIEFRGTDYVTFNSIDIVEDTVNNTTATTRMEWGYGIFAASGTEASHHITIRSCTITLKWGATNASSLTFAPSGILTSNTDGTSATTITPSAHAGVIDSCRIYFCTIRNCYSGINLYGSSSSSTYYSTHNEIGVSGGNSIEGIGGASTTSVGIFAIYQDDLTIANNSITNTSQPSAGSLYGILTQVGAIVGLTIDYNTIRLATNTATGAVYGIRNEMGGSSSSVSITDNTVTSCTNSSATSGVMIGISHGVGLPSSLTIANNTVSSLSLSGTGSLYGIQDISNSSLVSSYLYGNHVENLSRTGASGNLTGINLQSRNASVFNSVISNLSIASHSGTSTNAINGILNSGVPVSCSYHDNVISNLTMAGTSTGTNHNINGINIHVASGTTTTVYKNTISTLTLDASSGAGIVRGIVFQGVASGEVYRNTLSGLSTTGGGASSMVAGIQITGGTSTEVHTNFISQLDAPNATALAVVGISAEGSSGCARRIAYNTVFLNATGTGASVGSGALHHTAGGTLDVRNNIFVNLSTTGASGHASALYWPSAPLTDLGTLSNNNCLYAGTPGSGRYLFFDGTIADQTLAAYRARVLPRESFTFSELPPFVNSSTPPFDLHLSLSTPTLCESGGQSVTAPAITSDYEYQARAGEVGYSGAGTAPDVGADEAEALVIDRTLPSISHTPLSNTLLKSTRVISSVVITDASGVDSSGGLRPRLYYKKSTHANAYVDNTSATNGWKWVEASTQTSPFSFTIDHTLLYGGAVSHGDQIQYFFVAQDRAPVPNVLMDTGTCAVRPWSVALESVHFPISGGFPFYTVYGSAFSGTYTVGAGRNLATIAEAIEGVSTYGVGSAVTFLVDAGHTETGVNLVLATTTTSASNPVEFRKSGSGSNPRITAANGTCSYDGIIEIRGTDYVTVDGIDLVDDTVAHTSTTTRMEWGIGLFMASSLDAAQHITIRNCTIGLKWTQYGVGILARLSNGMGSNYTPLAESAISSYCQFTGNTIINAYSGILIEGGSTLALHGQGNEIGTVGAGNVIQGIGGKSTPATGIGATNQQNVVIAGNSITNEGMPTFGDVTGIDAQSTLGTSATILGNNILLSSRSAVSSALVGIFARTGTSTGTDSVVIRENVLHDFLYPTRTGGVYTGIQNDSKVPIVTIADNTVEELMGTGSANIVGIHQNSANSGTLSTISNNTIDGIHAMSSSGSITGILSTTCDQTVTGNVVTHLLVPSTSGSAASTVLGYSSTNTGGLEVLRDNTITTLSIGGTTTAACTLRAILSTVNGTRTRIIEGTDISDLAATGTAGGWSLAGIDVRGTAPSTVHANQIAEIHGNGSNAQCEGIDVVAGNADIVNNRISRIWASSSSLDPALIGIRAGATGTDTVLLAQNTVVLDGSSASPSFASAAVQLALSGPVALRNNIFVNLGSASGAGSIRALQILGEPSDPLVLESTNRNCFYVGTPSTTNVICKTASTSYQTLPVYQAAASPRESFSFSELPPFVNIATAPYNLHVQVGPVTLCESGGTREIAPAYPRDADGDLRFGEPGYAGSGTAPDVGADEGDFTPADRIPPLISYSPIADQYPGASTLVLTNVTITDPSSVDGSSGKKPRIWYRKLTDVDTLIGNTSATTGWKYTETTSSASPYSFTINYSLLFGGGANAKDTILYFVTAQDQAPVPSVAIESGSFASVPSSSSLTKNQFPVGGSVHQYAIYGPLSGTYPVGAGQRHPTIASAITSLNTLGVDGPVTFDIPAGHTETLVNAQFTTTTPSATNTVTFRKVGSGANPLVTAGPGTGVYDGLIEFRGTDNVTFDGIDLADDTVANTTTTTRMEWGFGIFVASATDASRYITIRNCRITLKWAYVPAGYNTIDKSSVGILVYPSGGASDIAIAPTSEDGVLSGCSFDGNTIHNAYNGIVVIGSSTSGREGRDNRVGTLGGNTITGFGGKIGISVGIHMISQIHPRIEGNVVSTQGQYIEGNTQGVYVKGSGCDSVMIRSNTIRLEGSTGELTGIYVMADTNATLVIQNNLIRSLTAPSATSASLTGIRCESTVRRLDCTSNIVDSLVLAGTGTLCGLATSGSLDASVGVQGNTVTHLTKTGPSGLLYGIRGGGARSVVRENIITDLSAPSTSGTASTAIHGCYHGTSSVDEEVVGNTIADLSCAGAGTSSAHLISGITSTSPVAIPKEIADNVISGLQYASTSGTATVTGISIEQSSEGLVRRNRVFDLSNESADGTSVGIGIGNGPTITLANNMISDLRNPQGNLVTAGMGISLSGIAGDEVRLHHNTVVLSGSSTEPTYGSTCVYANALATLDLRGNILVNLSAVSSGRAVALCFASVPLAAYGSTSNNNAFSCGAPAANRYLYYDGVAGDTGIVDFRNRVAPREGFSFSEVPPFVNIATTPWNLHLQSGIPTLCEGGVRNPSDETVDEDGDQEPRPGRPGYAGTGTRADVGADEGNFSEVSRIGPSITWIRPTLGWPSGRPLSSVSITDADGVELTPGKAPRVYYKRSGDANTWVDNTSATEGWKYVESASTGSPFSFALDHALLYGGLPSAGDTIQYVIVASDRMTVPNISFATGQSTQYPATTALEGIHFPLTGLAESYVVSGPLSGSQPVGTGKQWTSVGEAIEALNHLALSGPVSFDIDPGHTEILMPAVVTTTYPDASHPVTFRKNGTGVNPLITAGQGTGNHDGIIEFRGSDYVTFDGIDLADDTLAHGSDDTRMEWGFGIFAASGSDASRHITIRNATIHLKWNYANPASLPHACVGILAAPSDGEGNTIMPTSEEGVISHLQVEGSTIHNAYCGIVVHGDGSDTAWYGQSTILGGTSGNSIAGIGGGTESAMGIHAYAQKLLRVEGNSITTVGQPSGGDLAGIFVEAPTRGSAEILANTITVQATGSSGTLRVRGIQSALGEGMPGVPVTIEHNTITQCSARNDAGVVEMTGIHLGPHASFQRVAGNTIDHCATTGTGTGMISGLLGEAGSAWIEGQDIHDVSGSGASTTVAGFRGLGGSVWTLVNTTISDLRASQSTQSNGVRGMSFEGGDSARVLYTTVFLFGANGGVGFGSSGLYCDDPVLDVRNTLIVNRLGSNGGMTVALRRADASLASYGLTSNHNGFYCGNPTSNAVIYHDGTNTDISLLDFKNRVTPRETFSFSEMPPFQQWSSTPYDLHLATGTTTLCESGGRRSTAPAVMRDRDGELRHGESGYAGTGTAPDVGSDEGNFTSTDRLPPTISFSGIPYSAPSNTVLLGGVSISDASGLNLTMTHKPRVYYRKTIDADTWVDNTAATDGWKWVETADLASPFTFTINHTLLHGGVAAGDTILYFIVAEDLAPTPNVGTGTALCADPPWSVALQAMHFPLSGTPARYPIRGPLSGTQTVGAGKTWSSLASAFDALNMLGIDGPTVFEVDAGHGEVLANAVLTTTTPTATNTLTFRKSGSGANPLITAGVGVGDYDGIIEIEGTDYVTFDGIDLAEDTVNHVTATTLMEYGYGILTASLTDASHHITIRNCTITMKWNAPTVGAFVTAGIFTRSQDRSGVQPGYVSAPNGVTSHCSFDGNTIRNAYIGIYLVGVNDVSPYARYGQNNSVGVGGGNTITGFGGRNQPASGIYTEYQNAVTVSNNTVIGGAGTTGTLTGITLGSAYHGTAIASGNTVEVWTDQSNFTVTGITCYAGKNGSANTVTIQDNLIHNTGARASTLDVVGIMCNDGPAELRILSNHIDSLCGGGTVRVTGIDLGMRSPTVLVSGNTIERLGRYNLASTGQVRGITHTAVTSGSFIMSENIIRKLTSGRSATVRGISCIGFSTSNFTVTDNVITELRSLGMVQGVSINTASTISTSGNSISDLTADSLSGYVAGMSLEYFTTASVRNTMIGDLNAPLSTYQEGVIGVNVTGSSGTIILDDNTVVLDARNSSSTFGTSAVSLWSGIGFTLRNTILVNLSDHGSLAGSKTVALRCGDSMLLSYATASNRNCFFAGDPTDAKRILYDDGFYSLRDMTTLQTILAPRESSSFRELPPFASSASRPWDLHLTTARASLCESGGLRITSPALTTDIDGDLRQGESGYSGSGTAPDVGADEYAGVRSTPPAIAYTPLTWCVTGTSTRTLSVSITSGAGILTIPGSAPRVYYRKATDANTWVDNTSASSGWKWVESSSGTSPFSFTIDHTLLYGGSVSGGDTIQYFVVAATAASPSSIGMHSGTFNQAPSSVQLSASAFPVSGTLTSYPVRPTLSGTVSVGAGGTYGTLKALFDAINAGVLTGSLVAELVGDCNETAHPVLNVIATNPPDSLFSLVIRPTGGSTRIISRSVSTGQAVFTLDDADRVTIDGLGEGGNGITVQMTNAACGQAAVLWLRGSSVDHGCTDVTLRHLTILGSTDTTGTNAARGIALSGSSVNQPGYGFARIIIESCLVARATYGISALGHSSSPITQLSLLHNELGGLPPANEIKRRGILLQSAIQIQILNNEIHHVLGTSDPVGIELASPISDGLVSANAIHDIGYTGSDLSTCIGLLVNTSANPSLLTVSNNRIWAVLANRSAYGLSIEEAHAGTLVAHNSILLSGLVTRAGATSDMSAALRIGGSVSGLDLRNNIVSNGIENTNGVAKAYAIYSGIGRDSYGVIDRNVYHAFGPEAMLGYVFYNDRATLSIWKSELAPKDQNTTDLDPRFVSTTDLSILPGLPTEPVSGASNRGTLLSDISEDCEATPRDSYAPDAGAYEFSHQHRAFSTPGTLSGIGIDNLTLTGPGTWTLSGDLYLAGVLTLNGALLDPNGFVLTLGSAASIGGSPGIGAKILGTGEIRKVVSGTGSFTWPVGTGTDYTPATLTLTAVSVTSPAWVGLTLTASKHGQNPSLSSYLTRYWTLTATGLSGISGAASFTYADGDVVGNESQLFAGKYDGRWVAGDRANAPTNTLNFSNLTGFSSFTGLTEEAARAALTVNTKVFLQGSWNGTGMNAWLNNSDSTLVILPLAQPYSDPAIWNYPGTENVSGTGFFSAHPDIVDWVLLELRTGNPASPPMTVVERRAALLRTDGTVVDMDGMSPVSFATALAGSYHVVLRQRNHMAVMSAAASSLNLTSALYDFTTAQSQAYSTNTPADAMKALGTVFGLLSGDATGDGFIDINDFTDADNNQFNAGYLLYDTNLDGFVDINDFTDADNGQFLGTQVP